MIRFACPHCSAIYTVSNEKAGATTKCTKCAKAMQIPEAPASPPPPPPPAAKVAPAAPKKSVPVDDEDDRPRRRSRPVIEDDEDDRPRRRSRPVIEDDEDDRPRRRARRDDDDDDDYDDRPRRRSRRDDDYDDDYDDRPRKKKGGFHPLVLTVGILFIPLAILIAVFAIINIDEFKNPVSEAYGKLDQAEKNFDNFPQEMKSQMKENWNKSKSLVSKTYWLMLIFEISIYFSLVTSLIWLAAGIGLILQQKVGRIVAFVASGFSGFVILLLIVHTALILSIDYPKGETGEIRINGVRRTVEGPFGACAIHTGNLLIRYLVHLVPLILAASTLFLLPMKKLRNSF